MTRSDLKPQKLIDSAMLVAGSVHTWLPAKFNTKKLQQGPVVVILGVSYDLVNMKLHIKTCRKAEIRADIGSILKADELEPGHAG